MAAKPTLQSVAMAHQAGRLEEAEAGYHALLKAGEEPPSPILANMATIHLVRGDPLGAEKAARAAIAADPDGANGHNNLGLALKTMGRPLEALEAFRASLRLDPTHAEAWTNAAQILFRTEQYPAALDAIRRAIAADQRSATAVELALYLQTECADWAGLDQIIGTLAQLIAEGRPVTAYALIGFCQDPAELKRAAQNRAKPIMDTVTKVAPFQPPAPSGDGRIRLGYFSSTMRSHATGYLMRQVLTAHDRSKFRLSAYVFDEKPIDDFTRALREPFEAVIDLTQMTDAQATDRIRADAPDIIIDIDGYANWGRPAVLAPRCAVLQAAWLGHPLTIGLPNTDVYLADDIAVPPGSAKHFTEQVVSLPDGFFPGDGNRVVSDRFKSRAALGLPNEGIVFCAFNQTRKINPPVIDVWAAILRAVPGSVIWMWQLHDVAVNNLEAAFAARGIGSERIFWAKSLPSPDHLCRYRFADVVLDTWPCNGHTMTSDALYMGVPVVTMMGRTLPSRVAASLIARLGLTQELVAEDPNGYAVRGVTLARQAQERKRLSKLIKSRAPDALYNTPRLTKGLETALMDAWIAKQAV